MEDLPSPSQECIAEGCFVYQVVVHDGISVRHQPEAIPDETTAFHYDLERGELVEVDMVLRVAGGDVVLARLADQSGWVPTEEDGQVYMKAVPIESGLWSFFVDNYPLGQAIRRHPMDAEELLVTERDTAVIPPLTKVYCDVRVVHPESGVCFYRLQGGGGPGRQIRQRPGGWLVDRRPATKEGMDDVHLLLEPKKVQTGLKVYQALIPAAIRNRTDVADHSKTSVVIEAGEMVFVDCVREAHYARGNGPFVRLADGSGWLFESKLFQPVLKSVPVERGLWEFKVLNEPVGVGMRRHPVDRQDMLMETVLASGEMIQCDLKVEAPHLPKADAEGPEDEEQEIPEVVSFYRVRGTDGWVFDRRGETPMLQLLSCSSETAETQVPGWTPDFCRGIAATVDGLTEVQELVQGNVLVFETADKMRMNVYCNTQTVATVSENGTDHLQRCHRHVSAKKLLELLSRDVVEMTMDAAEEDDGEEKKDNEPLPALHGWQDMMQEEELRNALLQCEVDLSALLSKRRALLNKIGGFDEVRAKEGERMRELTVLRTQELERLQNHSRLKKVTKVARVLKNGSDSSTSGRSSTDRSRDGSLPRSRSEHSGGSTGHVCGECFKVFPGKYSRDLHCREAHDLFCRSCDRIFVSFAALDEHRDRENHW